MSNGIERPPGMLPCSFPARRDLGAALRWPPGKNLTRGGIAVVRSKAGWSGKLPRGQRILDGLAGVCAGGWLEASFRDSEEAVSMEMVVPNVALIP
jgi:hypothetical protein